MASIRFAKVVASLPAQLDPDTLYMVRVGDGFDLYCSDATGSIAHRINTASQGSSKNSPLLGRGILVPMYIYPHNGTDWVPEWKSLWETAGSYGGSIDVIVVINPASGPGAIVDIAYQRAIDRLLGAKAVPIGYVTTGYGTRSLQDINADIDLWASLYPDIRGVFFDEVSTDIASLPTLSAAAAYARNKISGGVVAGNPGTWVDQAIQTVFDICVTHEDVTWPLEPTMDWPDSPLETLNNMACIVRGAPSVDDSKLLMASRFWRWVFVSRTNDFSSYDYLGIEKSANIAAAPNTGYLHPSRVYTPKIIGDVSGSALTTLALTASRQYFIPFSVQRPVYLSGLKISVTTASAGQVSVGIYDSVHVLPEDWPNNLVAFATGINTWTTGDKTGAFNYLLKPGRVYWASLISSAAATIRALPVASVQSSLGRTVNNTTVISHLYAAGSGATLPATAPTTLTNGTGSCPAIYLLE